MTTYASDAYLNLFRLGQSWLEIAQISPSHACSLKELYLICGKNAIWHMCVQITGTACIRMLATTVYDVPYLFASEGVHGFLDFGKRPFAQRLAQQVVADALCVCERSQHFF